MEENINGKKSVWKWIVIFLLIGAVVYGTIYYFMIAGKNVYSPTPISTGPTSTIVQTAPASGVLEMTIKLNEENNSGESGEATLKEDSGKTTVTVNLTGSVEDVPQPAHIHLGSCPGVGAVKYPLTTLMNGSSVTILNVTLNEIKQNLPLAINVHKSAQEINNYTACGQLPLQ